MRFGVREICNVVLRAKATQTLGSRKFYKNEPVLYFDSLKTSSVEGASTTVYATGGRGNTRLVAWEGERTLTFTMEDALITPEGFAILSGAGLVASTNKAPIYVHTQSQIELEEDNTIILPEIACWNKYDKNGKYKDYQNNSADIFVMVMKDGEIVTEPCVPVAAVPDLINKTTKLTCYSHAGRIEAGDVVLVDYYVKRTGGSQQIEITPDKFGGNYYLEASTLFRRERDGVDMPAEFIIPNCKVQSNFTFTMASSGDPSTFTFTMDAFPDYTKFDKTHKVLAAIQVIEDQYDDEEVEERTACVPFDYEVFTAGVTASYDNDSTDERVKMTVTGNNVNGFGYDVDNWGTVLPDDIQLAEVELILPVENGKTYKLITHSPLHQYYESDPNIKKDADGGLYKELTKTVEGETWPIVTAVSNRKGVIDFALYEVTNKGDVLVKTVTIKNDLAFVKKARVTVTDAGAKMGDKRVNENPVDDFNKVGVGDTLCFTADGATEVTVDSKTVVAEGGIYTVPVTKAALAIAII